MSFGEVENSNFAGAKKKLRRGEEEKWHSGRFCPISPRRRKILRRGEEPKTKILEFSREFFFWDTMTILPLISRKSGE